MTVNNTAINVLLETELAQTGYGTNDIGIAHANTS